MINLPRECRTSYGVPKTKYSSETDAQAAMLAQVGNGKGWHRRLLRVWHVYVCGHCGYMHIGRNDPASRLNRLKARVNAQAMAAAAGA